MLTTFALAVPNFLAFFIGSLYLGGDARNGYVKAGHYFLCSHGRCTEVTQSVWTYSYWHALIAMGGILLVFAELAIFVVLGRVFFDRHKSA
jgi:hypothetical protein